MREKEIRVYIPVDLRNVVLTACEMTLSYRMHKIWKKIIYTHSMV